jgi:hypothetical protein
VVKPVRDNKFNNSTAEMSLVFDKSTKIEAVHDDETINEMGKENTLTFT